jgi:hypothetical protein
MDTNMPYRADLVPKWVGAPHTTHSCQIEIVGPITARPLNGAALSISDREPRENTF